MSAKTFFILFFIYKEVDFMESFNGLCLSELQDELRTNSLRKVVGINLSFKNIQIQIVSLETQQVLVSGELVLRTDTFKDYITKVGFSVAPIESASTLQESIDKATRAAYSAAEQALSKKVNSLIISQDEDISTASEFVLVIGGLGYKSEGYVELYASCLDGKKVTLFSEDQEVIKWLLALRVGTQISVAGTYEGAKDGGRYAVRAKSLIKVGAGLKAQ